MTKSQIKIIGEGEPSEDVTLDYKGYPGSILLSLNMAYERYRTRYNLGNRPGIVASFLCAENPNEFEPRAGHDLRSDIDYYHKLYTKNEEAWELETLKRVDAPEFRLETIVKRTPFINLVRPKIETS